MIDNAPPAPESHARKDAPRKARKPGAGRPPKGYVYDPKSIHGLRDQARARAAASMGNVVALWELMVEAGLGALRGDLPRGGIDWGDINRAAENLADRAGLARKSELDIETDLPQKLWSLATYRTKDGERHELPRDPSGDTEPA